MPLAAVVTLALAGIAAFLAYRDEKLGAAILVGAAVLTALYLLLGAQGSPGTAQTPAPLVDRTSPAAPYPRISP